VYAWFVTVSIFLKEIISRISIMKLIYIFDADVFHWNCLDHYARQLPGTMAPAGYTCPSCQSFMFPPSNLVSPVADVLRKKFETVNWARVGLGLPLVIYSILSSILLH
jgi:hypothetical protein